MNRKLSEKDKKVIACNQQWRCSDCGQLLPSSYQVDHIVPYCISYNDDYSNLTALCPTCHANKTQKECNRIIKFKRYISTEENKNVCWFCLNPNIYHTCDKILKKINVKYKVKEDTSFDHFYYIENLEKDLDDLKLNTTLNITLEQDYIFVNNFFTKVDKYTLDEIVNAVFLVTRTKKDTYKYTEVEINININNIYSENKLINFLDNLRELLPKRIFNPKIKTRYIYLFLED